MMYFSGFQTIRYEPKHDQQIFVVTGLRNAMYIYICIYHLFVQSSTIVYMITSAE